jgi:hypothetical protein
MCMIKAASASDLQRITRAHAAAWPRRIRPELGHSGQFWRGGAG